MVSKKQRGVIQDLHREVWSLSAEHWPGDSIVIKWTLKKSLENSMCHIMGRLKFLLDRQFAIHPGFLLKFKKNDDGFLKCKMSKSLMDKISAMDKALSSLLSTQVSILQRDNVCGIDKVNYSLMGEHFAQCNNVVNLCQALPRHAIQVGSINC